MNIDLMVSMFRPNIFIVNFSAAIVTNFVEFVKSTIVELRIENL